MNKRNKKGKTKNRKFVPFFVSTTLFQSFLEGARIFEVHADGHREERGDILLLYNEHVPLFLVFYEAFPYSVVVRCEEKEAGFCLQHGSDVLYAKWYRVGEEEEILKLHSRSDALTWLATQHERLARHPEEY